MEELDRQIVDAALRVSIHSEALDTFQKAQRFMKRKNIAVDALIEHSEEIEAIYERLKGLPPSPPSSGVDPAEKLGNPGEGGQGAGTGVVPWYDKEVRP